MITKWKVANFKSIQEERELDLSALTIFAGANSSGKSTFIQSILLIAQTLANKVGSRSVVLNGAFANLGQFDDLKSNGGSMDQIAIKCTCRPYFELERNHLQRSPSPLRKSNYYGSRLIHLREVSCEILFDSDPSSTNRELYQIQPRLFSSQICCTTSDLDNIDKKAEISVRYSNRAFAEIKGLNAVGEIDDQLRASLAYEVELDASALIEVREDYRSAQAIGCGLKHFLPNRVIYSIDTTQEDANMITLAIQEDSNRQISFRRNFIKDLFLSKEVIIVLREILGKNKGFNEEFRKRFQRDSLFGPDIEPISIVAWFDFIKLLPREIRIFVLRALDEAENLYDRIYEAMKLSSKISSEPNSFIISQPPKQIAEANLYLENFFAFSLKYLGPLRVAPKPLYPIAPAAEPNDVGLLGEHTASILELHKNKKIKYIPSLHFKESEVDRKTVTRSLESAVVDWLKYLGVANSVISKDLGKLGHELKVILPNSDIKHDLTHVGVGVSQVLPILVMCLLAETDSTLVFEQPELHLHPKVQTLLGDFFLSMALCNKQCIVETHSEYFIDRIRFRIAAAKDKELHSKTKIYFVEKPAQNSIYREVVINEYGAIADWPVGFFDQSQKEAEEILKAALNKRREKKSGEKPNAQL